MIKLNDKFDHAKNEITYHLFINYYDDNNEFVLDEIVSDDRNDIINKLKHKFNLNLLNKLFLKVNRYQKWNEGNEIFEKYELIYFNPTFIQAFECVNKNIVSITTQKSTTYQCFIHGKSSSFIFHQLKEKHKTYLSFCNLKIVK